MSVTSDPAAEEGTPTYVTRFDGVRVPATDYQPVWVTNLADDVTIEGSAMNGVVRGAEAVRSNRDLHPLALRRPGVQFRRPLRRERLPGGLHGLGPRRAAR